jgi:hypothetical protein
MEAIPKGFQSKTRFGNTRPRPEGRFEMDDWNMNPERGKPWRLYVVIGILTIVAVLTAIAFAVSYYRPTVERVL